MKRLILLVLMLVACCSQAFAFNPNPIRYEYIGRRDVDKSYIFYEIATAKAYGQKAMLVLLQADPRNRTLRYYRGVVIDPVAMTIRASQCELYDYRGNVLETFSLPNKGVQYNKGDLTDKVYQDLLNKGIVSAPVPKPVEEVVVKPTPQPVVESVERPVVQPTPQPKEEIVYREPVREEPVQQAQQEVVQLPDYKSASVANWEEGLSGGAEAPIVELPPVEDVIADF